MEGRTPRRGMGWRPDLPDWRDYTPGHPMASGLWGRLGGGGREKALPPAMDLRSWCSPVENQGPLGSCTAQAGAALVEYFERRAFARHREVSRLFLYKATRDLMREKGDSGATLRATLGALVLVGVPPEEYWPYQVEAFDREPPAFCYAFAQNFQALSYLRLDPPGTAPSFVLEEVRRSLAGGIPVALGFSVFSSISRADKDGLIPFPGKGDRMEGGHAVAAVGYEDGKRVPGGGDGEARGALLIRNSWGTGWGESGYGWLPYEYVLQGLARDFWTLLKTEWVDTGQFGV